MSDFFDCTEEDLQTSDDLQFKHDEIVKFTCIDVHQNVQYGTLKLKCKVESGDHVGKMYNITLRSGDSDASKKNKGQFLRAFWTQEEIKAKNCKPARLVGRSLTAKSQLSKPREKDGKIFQNWQDFHDLGGGAATPGQPAQAAPTAAPTVNPAGQVTF